MCNFSTNIPISLRVAFASGVTIEKRWLRYLSDAANSPSGPPDANRV
jgi:hypothetical protein